MILSAHLMMLDVIVEFGSEVSADALAQGLQQRLARLGQEASVLAWWIRSKR